MAKNPPRDSKGRYTSHKDLEFGKDKILLPHRDEAGKFIETPTLLKRLEQAARRRHLEKFSDESYTWFRNKVRQFGNSQHTRDTLLKDAKKNKNDRQRPTTGYMYTYVYDALWKDDLPYWDAFPLIFMVGPAPRGFYGINLHYLPPKARAILFDELLKITNNKRWNARTKVQMTYELLKSSQKYKLFKPCFKHYLFKQVKSHLAMIPADEWEAALFMPTADFQKASNRKVWANSMLST